MARGDIAGEYDHTQPKPKKATMDELFRNGGRNLFSKKIDYGSPEITKDCEEIRKEKERIQNEASNFSRYDLEQIVFTI